MTHAHRTYDARQGEIDRLAAENEALTAEVKRLRGFRDNIDWLRRDEGYSVEIMSDNAGFHGPNCIISVNSVFDEIPDRMFNGETIDECLAKARAALNKEG